MKISALMTTYNDGGRLLRESIESVLNQTRKCDEFVIVNDGSIDNTGNIIKEYAEANPNIIFINRKENKGRVYSLNEGLAACTGNLVFINDADDFSRNDRFEKTIKFYEKIKPQEKVGAIGAKGYLNDGEKKRKYFRFLTAFNRPISKFQIYYNMPFIHSSCAYIRFALNEIGGFPTEVTSCIDYLAITKLGAKYNVYGINEYLVVRNIDGRNFFAQKKNQAVYERNLGIIEKWKSENYPYADYYSKGKKVIKYIKSILPV